MSTAIQSDRQRSRFFQAVEKARWELLLPDGARRLLASGDSKGRGTAALQFWLASDPDLSRRLLAWSNSPMFNLSRRLTSLDEIEVVLGNNKMLGLAMLAGVRNLFLPNLTIESYARERLWRHSMAVGAVASLVARTCNVADEDEALVAGALHDIGLLASEKIQAETFRFLVDDLDPLTDTPITERQIMGWDHQMLGAEVLQRWGVPQAYCDAARFHHQAHRASEAANEELVYCVVVADYLCSRCGWTELGIHNVPQPTDAVFLKLGIDAQCLTVIFQQLYPTLEHTRVFL